MSSAKTTNILLTCVLLVAVVFLALAISGRAEDSSALSAENAYRLEKINEVNDLVIQRQVVPEGYFRYLGEELAAAIEEYNSKTTGLRCA